MDDAKKKIISQYYYNPEHGYIGTEKLYYKLKDKGITKADINEFLNNQELYQVNKRVNNKSSFIPHYPLQEFQIDLIYLENKYLNDASYGLCCIDIFTKFADIELMKKKDEKSTTEAMEKILEKMGIPEMVYCDEGTEFNNKTFKKLMNDNNIDIIYTLKHAPYIERFNRTIKNIFSRYLQATDTKTILNVLPQILKNYNSTYHKSIGMTPTEAKEEKNIISVRDNLESSFNTQKREKIYVGDKVRTLIKEKSYDKKYNPRWSKEIHTIEKIEGQKYFIDNGSRYYLRAYLMKVDKNEKPIISANLEGTREGHLKELAKREKEEQTNKPTPTRMTLRPKETRKKPDKLDI